MYIALGEDALAGVFRPERLTLGCFRQGAVQLEGDLDGISGLDIVAAAKIQCSLSNLI